MSPHQCIEAIRAKMLRVSLAELADASGVSKRQLERIRGNYQSPTVETLQAVYDGLRLVKPARKPASKRPAAPSAAGATTRRPARAAATSASGDDAGSAGLGA